MVTENDKQFIKHWEEVRLSRSGFMNKIARGLPTAILFGLPILLSVIVVRIFFPDWYTKISNSFSSVFMVVLLAVLIAVLFYAYFRMHFKWEMNEQLYQELKVKQAQHK